MNLITASVLLLAMLAFRPTLIYGAKGLASGSLARAAGNGKKHSALSVAKSKASLVMETEAGDIFVRRARGAGGAIGSDTATASVAGNSNNNAAGGGGSGKRSKNNNKKLNKNAASEQSPVSTENRKNLDKKFSATANQQHGNAAIGNNNKTKQRQLLKSQQHQTHGKRGGAKTAAAAAATNGEKSQSTCRYAKSAWSECDVKTNSKSRTLTLRKGEPNCLATRTIQKKCKKACRYEKGSWSECANGQMTRQDKLKSTGSMDSSSCEAMRSIDKKCNPGAGGGKGAKAANKERKNKDKASRRAQQQA